MRKLLLVLLLVAGATSAYPQCGMGPRKQLAMNIGLGATGSLNNKGMRMNTYNVDLNFSTGGKLSVIGSLEFADNHYKQDGAKLYMHNMGLAGGLGYIFLKQKDFQLQVVGKAGSTIGNADWKNNYYNASLRFIPGHKCGGSHILVGLGYRYANSHNANFSDHGFAYGTIGIVL